MDNKKLLYLILALCVPLLVAGATALSESSVLPETPNTAVSAPPHRGVFFRRICHASKKRREEKRSRYVYLVTTNRLLQQVSKW
jgi:hypothetical protein